MNWPWSGRSGLAKATAVLASILLVSTGLCGANFVGWQVTQRAVPVWIYLGILELMGMALGAIGLFVVLVLWIWRAIQRPSSQGD
jgi:hypothetical protein